MLSALLTQSIVISFVFWKSILSLLCFGMVEAYKEPTSKNEKEISKWRDEEPAGSSQ